MNSQHQASQRLHHRQQSQDWDSAFNAKVRYLTSKKNAMVKAIDSLIQYVDKLQNSYTHSTILATGQHGYLHTLLKLSTSLPAFYANRLTTYL